MIYVKAYFKKRAGTVLLITCLVLFFNFYYGMLVTSVERKYMSYFNVLLSAVCAAAFLADFVYISGREKKKRQRLLGKDIIYQDFSDFENYEIAEHDAEILKSYLALRVQENYDLQDYVAKWCHEVKIPLAASLLLDEKITDAVLRRDLRGQLEKISRQVNAMMLGCRLQGDWVDIQIAGGDLQKCVAEALKNNRFFLIQKRFEIDLEVPEQKVYTDSSWLIYILDQIISNAVKYAKEQPLLKIWTVKQKDSIRLYIEDNGEGVKEQDVRRVFEKGYTGSNGHNGKYKSTGMGLYMAKKIAQKLGHEILLESEYGKYTRVCIVFSEYEFTR